MAGGKPISYRKSAAEELNASRRPQSQDRTGSDHGRIADQITDRITDRISKFWKIKNSNRLSNNNTSKLRVKKLK